ncbi:hypothetical protein Leryth_005068 [Lithospermum erythrorhizon]|nr:hypothetical protein Leryth_005068 [Lithospermum erythrorhizon]
MILGDRILMELSGEDHKYVRGALVSFLKPECPKMYVSKVEEEIKRHLEMHWQGKENVKVLPLMKTLTFNIICSILFGVAPRSQRDQFVDYFQTMIEGMWAIPINLAFTRYSRSLKASEKVKKMVKDLIREKKEQLKKGASSHQDLITRLISIEGEGHDTSSVLITFVMRVLSIDSVIYEAVLKVCLLCCGYGLQNKKKLQKANCQEGFLQGKIFLVAMETLRYIPPVFGGFRTTLKDIEYSGYIIPKGWQVFWATTMTHMDDDIFEEPSKFNPAQFENQASIPPYCYIPFGAGPRICPGYEFA